MKLAVIYFLMTASFCAHSAQEEVSQIDDLESAIVHSIKDVQSAKSELYTIESRLVRHLEALQEVKKIKQAVDCMQWRQE